jgi:rod shape-determining protein MreD
MKRYLGYLILVLVLVPLEATLPRLPWLHAVRPLLHIPLILFFALRLNTIEGALLSFLTGTLVDFTVPYPAGLAALSDVILFVLARVFLTAFRSEGVFFEALLAAVLTALFHLMTWGLRRFFGPTMASLAGTPWMRAHLVACVMTALLTPFIFRAARRIEQWDARPPGSLS